MSDDGEKLSADRVPRPEPPPPLTWVPPERGPRPPPSRGGVLREVCRHAGVERITMCEIDAKVCEVSRKYLGTSTATSFGDARLTLVHQDAAEYVKGKADEYDVVIVDSSDPVGPAETLFTSTFYRALRGAMRPGAIMCNQGECVWLHLDLIGEVTRASILSASASVASWPSANMKTGTPSTHLNPKP